MNERRRLGFPVSVSQVQSVGIAVMRQHRRRKRMVPTEIHAANQRPVGRNGEWSAFDVFLGNRENRATTELWDALASRVALVFRDARQQVSLVFIGQMRGIIPGCHDHVFAHADS